MDHNSCLVWTLQVYLPLEHLTLSVYKTDINITINWQCNNKGGGHNKGPNNNISNKFDVKINFGLEASIVDDRRWSRAVSRPHRQVVFLDYPFILYQYTGFLTTDTLSSLRMSQMNLFILPFLSSVEQNETKCILFSCSRMINA